MWRFCTEDAILFMKWMECIRLGSFGLRYKLLKLLIPFFPVWSTYINYFVNNKERTIADYMFLNRNNDRLKCCMLIDRTNKWNYR
jgi:hypothetical protein